MSYLDIQIDYFPASVYVTKKTGTCSLGQLLDSIRNPKPDVLAKFKKIEEASFIGDLKLKAKLKSELFYFLLPVVTNGEGRTYADLVNFNGLALIDIDNLDKETAIELRDWLFDNYKCVVASFLSASKKGCKAIVRIPVVQTVEEFKEYVCGLFTELQYIKGFDQSSVNPLLPLYLTYDYDMKVREDAEVWTGRGYKENSFKMSDFEIEPQDIDITDEDIADVKRILTRGIQKITDQGHAILISNSIAAWGFVSAGYMTEEDMQDFMFDLIEESPYLSQKSRVYKRSCVDMKKLGLLSPLYLDRHQDEN